MTGIGSYSNTLHAPAASSSCHGSTGAPRLSAPRHPGGREYSAGDPLLPGRVSTSRGRGRRA